MSTSRLFLVAAVCCCHNWKPSNAFVSPLHRQQRGAFTVTLHSSSSDETKSNVVELKDFRAEAAGLFGNVRVPAALFAGASAGAAFAMPLGGVGEGLKIGLVKRMYALLMMGALSSQIVAVVVSTLSTGRLALSTKEYPKAACLKDFLKESYDFEWVSARIHFHGGLLCFILAVGLRAWSSIACPVISKAALGIIVSSSLLCLAFIQERESEVQLRGLIKLPVRYFQLLFHRARHSGMFAAALACIAATTLYVAKNLPHLYTSLN